MGMRAIGEEVEENLYANLRPESERNEFVLSRRAGRVAEKLDVICGEYSSSWCLPRLQQPLYIIHIVFVCGLRHVCDIRPSYCIDISFPGAVLGCQNFDEAVSSTEGSFGVVLQD